MIYSLGIDFGKKGGFCLLDANNKIVMKSFMPTIKLGSSDILDLHGVEGVLAKVTNEIAVDGVRQPIHVFGEKLHAIFGSSAKSTFSFGEDYGGVKALAQHWFGHCNLVRSQDWQKATWMAYQIENVKKKKSNGRDTKAMALEAANLIWPNEDWRATKRHKIPHDGIIDAALIAHHGLRMKELL